MHAVLAASEGFHQPITPALQVDVSEHLERCHFGLQFLQENGDIAGFALFKHFDDLLCGGGMMIRPAFQKSGLVGEAILRAREMTNTSYLAYRTQSPRMWAAGRKITSVWTPQPTGFYHPDLEEVRARAAHHLRVTPTITPGFFGSALYGVKPTHADPVIQAWWDSLCSFENGDAVLCVGRF